MLKIEASRRYAIFYTIITFSLSWAFQLWIIQRGGVKTVGITGLVILMWIPGAVAVCYRLLSKLGFEDSGLRRSNLPALRSAFFIPLSLAFITGLLAVLFNIRELGLIPASKLAVAAPMILVSLVAGILGAFGEELGWRGFLLPKLIEGKFRYPILMSGIIWALWHLPLVVFGGYYEIQAPLLIAISYTAAIIAITFVISYLRIHSRSLWPAVVLHAAHNFFFQLFFPALIFSLLGPNFRYWEIIGGDCGVIPTLLYGIMALIFMKRHNSPRAA
jgi:membrane protease YdiL (CAAX protease family)